MTNGINKYKIGKQLNETKLLIKTKTECDMKCTTKKIKMITAIE